MNSGDLSFAQVDSMGFSGVDLSWTGRPQVRDLGPLIELMMLIAQGTIPASHLYSLIDPPQGWPAIIGAAQRNRLIQLQPGAAFLRLGSSPLPDTERTLLSIRTKSAASLAGFDSRIAGQLTAALLEMLDNITEHSEATHTGLVAFQSQDGVFEFIVADQGAGALASLRSNPTFSNLETDREALPVVLKDGCSRHVSGNHGHGFSDLFRGLANHNGQLRFRSGDAAVLIDGTDPGSITPKVKLKPRLEGFFAAVRCSP